MLVVMPMTSYVSGLEVQVHRNLSRHMYCYLLNECYERQFNLCEFIAGGIFVGSKYGSIFC